MAEYETEKQIPDGVCVIEDWNRLDEILQECYVPPEKIEEAARNIAAGNPKYVGYRNSGEAQFFYFQGVQCPIRPPSNAGPTTGPGWKTYLSKVEQFLQTRNLFLEQAKQQLSATQTSGKTQ